MTGHLSRTVAGCDGAVYARARLAAARVERGYLSAEHRRVLASLVLITATGTTPLPDPVAAAVLVATEALAGAAEPDAVRRNPIPLQPHRGDQQ